MNLYYEIVLKKQFLLYIMRPREKLKKFNFLGTILTDNRKIKLDRGKTVKK